MRNTLLTSLLGASAAHLAAAGSSNTQNKPSEADQLACISSRAAELAAAASCAGSLQSKLHTCLADLPSLSAIESCFTDANCPGTTAAWALSHCTSASSDLRRRDAQPLAAIPTAAPHFVALFGREASSSPSPCFSDEFVTITQCTTDNGAKTCSPSASPSAVCVEGLICKYDNQGNPSCMYKHSSIGIAGIIIAIIFACALVVSIFGICFFCCKERKEQARLEKQAEAAKIAKEAKAATAAAKRPGKSVTGGVGEIGGQNQGQPLMYEGGDVGAGHQGGGGGAGYGSAANPFSDGHH
ncbi:hypothetical protein QBC43DRAFT_131655 [Cladorrhinum sp. PSN259]|nr:hypothetical protein QBC43DRAFT_131655 [Cladorrhinum sp. PSN259]